MRRFSHPVALLSIISLQGCISSAILDAPQEFIHQIDYVLNGVQHSVKTRVSCSSSTSHLSAADGFRNNWDIKGQDPQAVVKLGDNAAFLYQVTAPCNQKGDEQTVNATVIENLSNPDRFRRLTGKAEVMVGNNRIQIVRIFSRRATPSDAGVQFAQVDDKSELMNYRKRKFARVTASALNESVWGKDPSVREYFSKFTQLTTSTSVSRSDEMFSTFPLSISNKVHDYRNFNTKDGARSIRMGSTYRDGEFTVGEEYADDLYWYATGTVGLNDNSTLSQVDWVTVNYKGNKFRIRKKLELFDPTTRQFITVLRN